MAYCTHARAGALALPIPVSVDAPRRAPPLPSRFMPATRPTARPSSATRWAAVIASFALLPDTSHAQNEPLGATSVYQGGQASDAFSAIHYLGGGRIIAGKRSSTAATRFLLSTDAGASWQVVGCPESTGAHTYFFGQDGALVFSGTGDTGQACLMRSLDKGASWSVALSSAHLRSLTGSTNVLAVFSPVHVGGKRWLVNLKTLDTPTKIIMSVDGGQSWFSPLHQPGQSAAAWARQMIHTPDDVVLWPSCLSDRMYRSTDRGKSWSYVVVPGAQLFQPLCCAGSGIYFCGDVAIAANSPIRLHRSLDAGRTWTAVASVNLQRPTTTYWRDVIRAGGTLFASACCVEGTSNERFMQLHASTDDGLTWVSLGNPYVGAHGGMQAIYQMCVTEQNVVFAACQPDSDILRWQTPDWR